MKKLNQVLQSKRAAVESTVQEQLEGAFYQTPGAHHVHGKEFGPPSQYVHSPLPRIDFPRFDGSNPRAWVLKCSSFFQLMPNIHDAQRINLAILHFDGRSFSWIQNLNMGEIEITWKQFLEVVCARFEKLTVSNMMVELNELKQIGSYEDYVERFEELRAYILLNDSYRYSEDSFVASFLSGLSEELQEFINLFQPTNLEQAIELGRNRIHTLDAFSKRMSPDSSSFQIQFPTCKRTEAVPPHVASRLRTTISTNPTTKVLVTVGMPVEEAILDAQMAIELGISKLDPNMIQNVKEVHNFWKFKNAQRVVDLENPDTGWRDSGQIDDKSNKEYLPPDLLQKLKEYAGIFDEPVKLPLSREMEHQIQLKPRSIPKHQCSYMTSNNYKDDMAEETDAVLAKSTLLLGFLTSSGRATKVLQSFAIKIQSGLEFLAELSEVDAIENYRIVHLSLLGSRVINMSGEKLFPFLIPWITFGLKLVAGKNAAYFRCKKHIIVQKWPEVDDNINFKFEPLLVFTTHHFIQKSHTILQNILVQGLKIEAQLAIWKDLQPILYKGNKTHNTRSVLCSSVHQRIHEIEEIGVLKTVLETSTHPQIAGPIAKFYLCLSHCLSVLALYSIEENKDFQNFEQRSGLPEIESRFCAPGQILDKMGVLASTQNQPESSQLHSRFYFSLPKRYIESEIIPVQEFQEIDVDGILKIGLLLMWNFHTIAKFGVSALHFHVLGVYLCAASAIWEGLNHICCKFSFFNPRGRGSSSGGGIVMAHIGVNCGGDDVKKRGSAVVGAEVDLGKNANDGLKYIRRKFSSFDPRGRGSYQPGGIVMSDDLEELERLKKWGQAWEEE